MLVVLQLTTCVYSGHVAALECFQLLLCCAQWIWNAHPPTCLVNIQLHDSNVRSRPFELQLVDGLHNMEAFNFLDLEETDYSSNWSHIKNKMGIVNLYSTYYVAWIFPAGQPIDS